MTLRVVAGSLRGRRLAAPPGEGTRPTADRVREATFNSLASNGLLDGGVVLDLFAGSGAMGIEALSRGASSAVFVENSRQALRTLRMNLADCGLEDRSEVVPSDAKSFLKARPKRFDLALLDPPYGFDQWGVLFEFLDADAVVVESDRPVFSRSDEEQFADGGFEVIRERRYGTTVVTIAVSRRRGNSGEQPEDPQ